MGPLTVTQRIVLNGIRRSIHDYGYPPTIRELAYTTRLAPSTIAYQLGQLQAKGYLRRDPTVTRGIVIVDESVCPWCKGSGRRHDEKEWW